MPRDDVVIRPATVVVRSSEPVDAEVDGSVVMMSLERGKYYGLDAVATRIWQLLATPSTVTALCGALCEEFDVDPETCERDVLTFLERLAGEGLIEIQSGSAG